jgi:methylenetetrahydrofolate dehydrogenase (NADP+)/methenyltetrahydrofolate cyclohydrolase
MSKELNGRELASFIKERQAAQVRSLRGRKIFPKLAIFYDNDSPVIAKYMELKQLYGEDIHAEVDVVKITTDNAKAELQRAAQDDSVQGIIVQLPLKEVDMSILDEIPLEKDVDGLREQSDTATAMAIHWLLTGYGVELPKLKLAIVGQGKLVGRPLAKMWRDSGYDVTTFTKGDDLNQLINFDVIVTATGAPGVITSEMLKIGATVVDAGTASEDGVIKGDLADEVRERDDLILTPKIGGVGPLTVTMLFERVLQACEKQK